MEEMLTANDSAIIKTVLIFGYSDWRRTPLIDMLPFFKHSLTLGQNVGFARDPDVECRKQEYAHDECCDQSANDDNCERPLRVGTDRVRESRGQKSQRGHKHGHHDRAKPLDCALDRSVFDGIAPH